MVSCKLAAVSVVAAVAMSCSVLSQSPDYSKQSDGARQADGALKPPACLPARTGELVVNEILAKPGGVDLDGDGKSTGRDEALELIYVGDVPGHLQGAHLLANATDKGAIADPHCLQPGDLLVLTGSTALQLALPAGVHQLRLAGALELKDGGADLAIAGVLGTVLGDAVYPAAVGGQSYVRVVDGDRTAPWIEHPLVGGVRHSLGSRRGDAEAVSPAAGQAAAPASQP